MDRLEAMSIVLAVVEAGSLSGAARRKKTPLATISRKVSELESHLQTKLFNRSSRELVLTDAGKSYIAACKRILGEIHEAERAAAGEYTAPTGELIVTAPVGLGRLHLIPILADFFKAYPQIDGRLFLTDRIVSLLDEHVDVALRNGELPDSNLIALRVGTIRRVVCASLAYLKARGTPRTDASKHIGTISTIDSGSFQLSVTGLHARGMPIDISARIGFVVLVGLAAKSPYCVKNKPFMNSFSDARAAPAQNFSC